MGDRLLISGGILRPGGYELGEGKYYGKAVLLLLDVTTGRYEEILGKDSGGDHYPDENPNLQYTVPCIDGDVLWLPTDTEIFKYSLPDFTLSAVFSHRCFQNIHSVHVFEDEIAVTSTGLDQIVFLEKNSGNIKSIKSALGKNPWYRFDPETDYRLIHSTRPHAAHPNYVLKIEGEYWVTRCKQEDCVNLNDVSQLIDLTDSACISVHDGVLWNDKLIFTRVDGLLIVCDPVTKSKVEVIDIFEGHAQRPYGWCRGLHVNGDTIYIGFSSLRKTKLISKLKYLAKNNTSYFDRKNALVVKYSITRKKVEEVLHLPKGIDAIYGITHFDF